MAKSKKKKTKAKKGVSFKPCFDLEKRRADLNMYLKAFNKAIKKVMKDDRLLMKVVFSESCYKLSQDTAMYCINKIEFEDIKPLPIK